MTYFLIQFVLALPIILLAIFDQEIGGKQVFGFILVSFCTCFMFFIVAYSNPGYIVGNTQDEKRRAGAYDPKDY